MIYKFVEWVYVQNSNMWYWLDKEYTDYYDIEGERISQDDMVVYYGKRYEVYLDRKESEDGGIKGEWRIKTSSVGVIQNSISLEEAVKDYEGKLVIDKWEMGKK